jgi:hypothetical protein
MLFDSTIIKGLFCFENRKELFENVDSRFKFVVLTFMKGGTTESFPAAFMRHEIRELEDFPERGFIEMPVSFVKRQSPDSLSVMEIKNELDFTIAKKMMQFPALGEKIEGTWNLKLTREFDMTNDSHLFHTSPGKNRLPLYEGKMIHQFRADFAEPRYWVEEKEGRKALLGRDKDIGQEMDYQKYRLGFRDVAASTNERTLIASMIPPAFHGNKIPTVVAVYKEQRLITTKELLMLMAFMNSFVCDWNIRQRVTTTINFHYLYSLAVPRLTATSHAFEEIVMITARLICCTETFSQLWREVTGIRWTSKSGAVEDRERLQLRCKLDAIIAHEYGLREDEFVHVLESFPLVSQTIKTSALEEFLKMDS